MTYRRPLPSLRARTHPQRSFAVEPIKLSYSVKEAAEAIGTSQATIWSFIRSGHLPTFSLPGLERTLIKAVDLIAFVNDQPSTRRNRKGEPG